MKKPLLAAALAALLLPGCAAQLSDQELDQRIQKTLRENPEIVLQALENDSIAVLELAEAGSKARRARDAEKRFYEKLADPLDPTIDLQRPMLGDAQAPVTVVAYTDFLCAYCAKGAKNMKELMRRHPGKIRYMAKHVPMSETGEFGGRLFEALGFQDPALAWEFYMLAFEHQDEVRNAEDQQAKLLEYATQVEGVDAVRLAQDLSDERLSGFVRDDFLEFQSYGFRGVPVYLYNGAPLEGSMPLEFLEKAVARILGDATSGQDEFTAEEAGACLDCLDK
ncbi:DsbA family protein [Desulfovibrio ferrophilus]|uniref:DsbA oxidoreductase family protein n=1 Tax=Desulfovibrio ferrophilus TaxID=241368 RepID=A0A2Z6AY69_9BACT|nr:thioredoxin domain-containing protein [Desulfovibrio ferrophilus]BBD08189.1 DsbA oxidoreductase family protein [Desulfovibrio ferrophilus]